jgi:hypothetical protein
MYADIMPSELALKTLVDDFSLKRRTETGWRCTIHSRSTLRCKALGLMSDVTNVDLSIILHRFNEH